MAVQRKLPTKICECSDRECPKIAEKICSRLFLCFACKKIVKLTFLFRFAVQTTAHSQKVSCLDIGETGRVLVTGGHDRLVNLFAIGNDKPIQVSSREDPVVCAKKRNDDENEVKSLMSVGSVCVLFRH
jgi:WD40 repeat protein